LFLFFYRTIEAEKNKYISIRFNFYRYQKLAHDLQQAVSREQEIREVLVSEIEALKKEFQRQNLK